MGTYRVAEVCPNGHVSTTSADTAPELRERFCSRCGESTNTKCAECEASIRGYYDVEGVISIGEDYTPPSYCHNCGNPFPWTGRKIEGAVELLQAASNLSEDELAQFQADLEELTRDSPRVQAASVRFKSQMSKVGSSVAAGVKEIVVDVLSEAAKKAIWGA